MFIETSRLILRDFIIEDVEAFMRYNGDRRFNAYILNKPTREQTEEFVAKKIARNREIPRNGWSLSVILKEKNTVIGTVSVFIDKPKYPEVGMLAWGFDPGFWGQGYAAEATRALMQYAFDQIGMHRLEAVCDTNNHNSYRLMERIGMQREGMMRKNIKAQDVWCDTYLYACLKQEWSPLSK